MEMKTVRLGDLYSVSNGLSKGKEFFGSGYPFLTFSEVMNNFFVPDTLSALVQTDDKERNKFSIKRGDIFLNRTSETPDELGISCVALKDYPDATFNGFCKRLRPISDDVVPEFIGYYLRSNSFRNKMSALTGSMITRASLRNEQLTAIEIKLPSKSIQKKIATVLRQYDLIIDNCKKQIALLEEAAQRLYREWFVDMRFPGYESTPIGKNGLPEGWSLNELQDIANITMGQSPSSQFYNDENIGLPFHQGVSTFGDLYIENSVYTSKWNKEATANSILFSVRAPVGRINLTLNRVAIGRGLAALNQKSGFQKYLYLSLRNKFYKDDIIGNGTIYSSISKAELETVEILNPDDEVVHKFETIVSPYLSAIEILSSKLYKISSIKDFFLPRLISGEIEVTPE